MYIRGLYWVLPLAAAVFWTGTLVRQFVISKKQGAGYCTMQESKGQCNSMQDEFYQATELTFSAALPSPSNRRSQSFADASTFITTRPHRIASYSWACYSGGL